VEGLRDLQTYLNRCTLIYGDVNSGKTARMSKILRQFVQAGYGAKIAVIDMAPQALRGIGGKLDPPSAVPLLYLTADIAAPRLSGIDAADSARLARCNARMIEALFAVLKRQPREILFVNDASLYLQAGDIGTFRSALESAATCIINAYYGAAFADSALSRRERHLVQELMKACNILEAQPPVRSKS